MRGKRHRKVALRSLAPAVPGIFTFGNLLCGFFALLHTFGERPENAAWFIFIGAFLDILDGKVARITKTSSNLGIQLDTIADFLTFGIAPVMLMYAVGLFTIRSWRLAVGIIYLFAGAFRLARFNVGATIESAKSHVGLPIPVAAVAIASGILFIEKLFPPLVGKGAIGAVAILAWLMVSNVRYLKGFPKIHFDKYLVLLIVPFIIAFVFGLIFYPIYLIFPLTLIYILFGLVKETICAITHKKELLPDEISCESDSEED